MDKEHVRRHEKPFFSVPVMVHTNGVDVTGTVENRNGQYTVVHFVVMVSGRKDRFLARRKGMFQLNLRTGASGAFPEEFTIDLPIKVPLTSYLSDDFKQLNVNLRKCRVSCEGVFGNVVVKDRWYMPMEYRERQKRKVIRESIRDQIRAERLKPGSRTVYLHNNVERPFSGGMMSPR